MIYLYLKTKIGFVYAPPTGTIGAVYVVVYVIETFFGKKSKTAKRKRLQTETAFSTELVC